MVLYAMHYVQCHSKVQLWETLSQSRIKNNFGPVVNLLVHFLRQCEWRFERVNTQNTSVNRIQAPLIDRTVRIYSRPLAVYLTISLYMLTHIHNKLFYCWPSRSPSVTSISVVQSWIWWVWWMWQRRSHCNLQDHSELISPCALALIRGLRAGC